MARASLANTRAQNRRGSARLLRCGRKVPHSSPLAVTAARLLGGRLWRDCMTDQTQNQGGQSGQQNQQGGQSGQQGGSSGQSGQQNQGTQGGSAGGQSGGQSGFGNESGTQD